MENESESEESAYVQKCMRRLKNWLFIIALGAPMTFILLNQTIWVTLNTFCTNNYYS